MSRQANSTFSRALALVWCGALALFLFLPPKANAQDQVRINLLVVVTDGNGNPVPKAQISIPRQGHNSEGKPLAEITGETSPKGEFTRLADFELTGVAHKLRVTSGDIPVEEELPDQTLRDALNNPEHKLTIPISVFIKESVRLTIVGTVTDENGVPIPSASVSIDGLGTSSNPQLTGQDGRFKLANLDFPVGKESARKLRVSATNFAPLELDINDDSLRRNANGALEMGVIRLSSSLSNSYFEELKSIVNFLLWVLGLIFILVLVGYVAYAVFRKTRKYARLSKSEMDEILISTNSSVKTIEASIQTLRTSTLTEDKLLKHLPKTTQGEESTGQSDAPGSQSGESIVTITTEDLIPAVPVPDSRMSAKSAYEKLVNKISVSPEPVYLVVEPPGSEGGKMEDRNTYLSELPHSNCSLVLIADGSNSGWIFPNPKVAFNTAAVKDVFRDLTEVEYETNKLGIKPMRASKVDEGRWMLVVD